MDLVDTFNLASLVSFEFFSLAIPFHVLTYSLFYCFLSRPFTTFHDSFLDYLSLDIIVTDTRVATCTIMLVGKIERYFLELAQTHAS